MSPAQSSARAAVATCTLEAAHRRDHEHNDEPCAPHCMEVVRLGSQAAMVCHDCGTDTGFIDARDADQRCREHTAQTRRAA